MSFELDNHRNHVIIIRKDIVTSYYFSIFRQTGLACSKVEWD